VITRHGEVLAGAVGFQTLRVQTKYGLLEIPLADVVRVDFAPRLSDAEAARIATLIESTRDPAKRPAAREEILRLGSAAILPLGRARKEDKDLAAALEPIEGELRDAAGKRNLEEEVVSAKRFSAVGRVEIDDLSLSSTYGSLRVLRSDIDRLIFQGASLRDAVSKALLVKSWTDPNEEFVRTRDAISRRTKIRLVEFNGSSGAELKKAIKAHRVVVIPELEQAGDDAAQVAREAASSIRKWVEEGGVIVSCGGDGNVAFLAQSGVLACSHQGSDDSGTCSIVKKHAIVQGVSGGVPYANATYPIQVEGKSKMQPLVTGGGGIVVGVAKVGAGAVVYCGWDFYDSAEPHQKILANAVRWAAGGEPIGGAISGGTD
jgi:hypothetical protein